MSAIASTRSSVCYIEKKSYEEHIKDTVDRVKKKTIGFILSFFIFRCCDIANYIIQSIKNFKYEKINRNEFLIKENTKNDSLYFIKSGKFEITKVISTYELNDLLKYYGDLPEYLESEENELKYSK